MHAHARIPQSMPLNPESQRISAVSCRMLESNRDRIPRRSILCDLLLVPPWLCQNLMRRTAKAQPQLHRLRKISSRTKGPRLLSHVWVSTGDRALGILAGRTIQDLRSFVGRSNSLKSLEDACRKVLNYCDAERFEVNLVNQEDQKITLLLTATPCVAVSGEISGAICIGQDITRLKDLDERKASMMAMVSHELKSPLHGILGLCSSLMGDTNLDASRVGTSLSAMYSCANRLLDMVANIMDTPLVCRGAHAAT